MTAVYLRVICDSRLSEGDSRLSQGDSCLSGDSVEGVM